MIFKYLAFVLILDHLVHAECPSKCLSGLVCSDADGGCPVCENAYWGRQCHHRTECLFTTSGIEYRGLKHTSISGKTCQRWTSQWPHTHSYVHEMLEGNYCRNPDGEPHTPWCYTMNAAVRWEYCDIPSCDYHCPAPPLETYEDVINPPDDGFVLNYEIHVANTSSGDELTTHVCMAEFCWSNLTCTETTTLITTRETSTNKNLTAGVLTTQNITTQNVPSENTSSSKDDTSYETTSEEMSTRGMTPQEVTSRQVTTHPAATTETTTLTTTQEASTNETLTVLTTQNITTQKMPSEETSTTQDDSTYETTPHEVSTHGRTPQEVTSRQVTILAATITDLSDKCKCSTVCNRFAGLSKEETIAALAPILEETRKRLQVNVTNLSSYVRSKTSASDDRTSSASIGYVGIIFLTITMGSLVMCDLLTFGKYISKCKARTKS